MKTNQLFKVRNLWILCFAMFWASCTNNEPPKVEQPATAPQQEASPAPAPATLQKVTIAGMKFDPSNIVVNKGDTLIFTNNDLVAHNVTQFPDSKWASPTLNPGDSWTLVPTQSDSFYCSIHPAMKGDITMK